MKLRLVKVITQAHFVLDDGDTLQEVVAEPVPVSAHEWPTYAAEKFPEAVEQLEAQLAARSNGDPLAATSGE